MGTPANNALRALRKQVHEFFDRRWLYGATGNRNSRRSEEYAWLAEKMGIPVVEDCHIAMFDDEMCRRALAALAADNSPI